MNSTWLPDYVININEITIEKLMEVFDQESGIYV